MLGDISNGARGERRRSPAAKAVVVVAVGAALAMTLPGVASRLSDKAPNAVEPNTAEAGTAAKTDLDNVPLYFEANQGQSDTQVKYLARTRDYNLFLTSDKAVIALPGDGEDKPGASVHMSLLGANPAAKVAGAAPLAGKVNYLNNADAAQRRTNIPTFAQVAYSGVYPGIDLAYYGKGTEVEYDFTLAPGADPNDIRLGIEGTDALRLDDGGNLVMSTAAGELVQHKPVLYQDVDGARRPVEGSFTLQGNHVGFAVGAYDAHRPLVIDPTLAYSTFLDGQGKRVEVDSQGNAYVAGLALSPDFPTTPGALGRTFNESGIRMVFVSKLNPSLSGLQYQTLIATTNSSVVDLALAPDGAAWVTGTNAFVQDVPVTPGSFVTEQSAFSNAFLVKLTPDGSTASYGTYFTNPDSTGTSRLAAEGLALDPSGDVWLTASISSLRVNPPFPTTSGAVKPTCDTSSSGTSCAGNLILARIHAGGDGIADLVYATFLGGRNMSGRPSVGADGTVYVFGGLNGSLTTTPNALHPAPLGSLDGFLMKVLPHGNGPADLLYSSFIGGSGQDAQLGSDADLALGVDGTVYLAYTTLSLDLPITPGAYQPFPRDGANIALQHIDTSRPGPEGLLYSTYAGGDGFDTATGLDVDGRGHMFVTGQASFNLLARDPLACCSFNKGPNDDLHFLNGDAYVLQLNPAGAGDADLVFSTFLGGAVGLERSEDIKVAVDRNGRARAAWVVGTGADEGFPVTPGAYKTTTGPGFLSKIDFTDQFPCTRTLTGSTPGPITAGSDEIVCLNRAFVSGGVVVDPGGEVRIRSSFVSGSIIATEGAAFTLCGSVVNGDVTVTGIAPVFVNTSGNGCVPNTVRGTSTLPGGSTSPGSTTTTILTTTSTTAPTTSTTLAPTTTTRPSTTTTTAPSSNCSSLRAQRQAFNAAIDAAEAGQSPATIAMLEQQRARQNATFDRQLASCSG